MAAEPEVAPPAATPHRRLALAGISLLGAGVIAAAAVALVDTRAGPRKQATAFGGDDGDWLQVAPAAAGKPEADAAPAFEPEVAELREDAGPPPATDAQQLERPVRQRPAEAQKRFRDRRRRSRAEEQETSRGDKYPFHLERCHASFNLARPARSPCDEL